MDAETSNEPDTEDALESSPPQPPAAKPRLTIGALVLITLIVTQFASTVVSLAYIVTYESEQPPRTKNAHVQTDTKWTKQLETLSRVQGPKSAPPDRARPVSGLANAALTVALLTFVPLGLFSAARGKQNPTLSKVGLCLCGSIAILAVFVPAFARAREKPVIYLYPESPTTVNVKLHYPGVLTETVPQYPPDGWTVLATPSGELTDPTTNRKYPYLFWEGRDTHTYSMNDGFVVPREQAESFLTISLTQLGLAPNEIKDFTDYWLPRLQKNSVSFIHFATDEYADQVPLEVTPRPDTIIRVFMLFRPANQNDTATPQALPHTHRHGFTLVEWGGTELD